MDLLHPERMAVVVGLPKLLMLMDKILPLFSWSVRNITSTIPYMNNICVGLSSWTRISSQTFNMIQDLPAKKLEVVWSAQGHFQFGYSKSWMN